MPVHFRSISFFSGLPRVPDHLPNREARYPLADGNARGAENLVNAEPVQQIPQLQLTYGLGGRRPFRDI